MSVWLNGSLRPGHLCPFCLGARAFLRMVAERPRFWSCGACRGTGSPSVDQPAELRIGQAQGRFLKQYPGEPS